ncbi:MAG: SMC-Scp complex subunit ScpB [Puniceicoccaceae bacterium]|nr:MAG: SMC-Scp complex subunit ScpB [Puniceicoccaceae bacterium]
MTEALEAAKEAGAEEAGEFADAEPEHEPVPSLVTQAQISDALTALMDEAEVQDKAYRVVEGPNGYQLVTAPQFAEFVRLLRGQPRPMKLSPAALETMSIIAYRQPVTRAEMEAIRGVSIDSALNKLIELELVHVTGRAELPGRPIQYGTTDKFLEFTGIKELDELPASDVLSNHQIDEWMRRSEEEPEEISDEDVGLSKEPRPDELPLDEKFAEIDWQKENAESDAAPETEERPV